MIQINISNSKSHERYEWYKSVGICVDCGSNEVYKNHVRCLVCLMEEREKTKSVKRSTESIYLHKIHTKRYKDLLKAFGVCRQCGKRDAVSGKTLCIYCANKSRNRSKKNSEVLPRIERSDNNLCYICSKTVFNNMNVCKCCYDNISNASIISNENRDTHNHIWNKESHADVIEIKVRRTSK